jgi:hypothetical protein
MQPDITAMLSRFAAGRYRPTTFLERGVAVPFTTPHLLGGRIRPGERRIPELVLANPAGTEGVYILPWAALPDFCPPSLHDRAIWSRINGLQLLTPRSVQTAARKVAAEGFAGRDAAAAARVAGGSAEQQRVLLHYHLLLELVRQGEPASSGLPPPERDTPTNVERRARKVLEGLRQDNSLPPSAAVDALEEISSAFEGTGLRGNPTGAALPLLCLEVATVIQQVMAWGDAGTPEQRQSSRLLVQAAEVTLRCARVALANAQAQLEDIWALVHRWRVEPDSVLVLVERSEWLLDGWRQICALWRSSPAEGRLGAALEMAALVPVIPSEVGAWCGFDASGEMDATRGGLRNWRRTVKPHQDWATGRVMERNEHLRAIAA